MNNADAQLINRMPCDEELLKTRRVQWATARLHFTMRDTNLLHGEPSDAPFDETSEESEDAPETGPPAGARIVEWADGIGGKQSTSQRRGPAVTLPPKTVGRL